MCIRRFIGHLFSPICMAGLTLELLHKNDSSLNLLLQSKGQGLAHIVGRGHLDEAQAAGTLAYLSFGILQISASRMRNKDTNNGPKLAKILFQLARRLEAKLVDAAHDDQLVWVLLGEELQARRQSLHGVCLARWHLPRRVVLVVSRALEGGLQARLVQRRGRCLSKPRFGHGHDLLDALNLPRERAQQVLLCLVGRLLSHGIGKCCLLRSHQLHNVGVVRLKHIQI
mmetsp:Transcript_121521/g.288860  ORF Transcript_121521/g.288860 Transcript_121521/m.288860 type:complete len:227 (-) Transcript_121521:552-1232(-)